MSELMKIHTGSAHLNSAVNTARDLPVVDSKKNDVRYCKKEACYYMFNGVRWFQVELISE
jgi:hypothetical protein